MMRPNGVEKQVRPKTWQPGANTVAYYPLNGDILDHKADLGISGTAYNLSVAFGTPTYSTSFDSSKVAFNPQAISYIDGGCGLQCNNSVFDFNGDFTVSFCVRPDNLWTGASYYYTSFLTNRGTTSSFKWMCMVNSSKQFLFHGAAQYPSGVTLQNGTWYNITCSVISGTYYIYINGTQVSSGAYSVPASNPSVLHVGYGYYADGRYAEQLNGCISEIIIDGSGWDATKALERAEYLGFA